jgi:hypothetical protein
MSIIGGVTVTGFIAPSSSGDTYAVIDPFYGIDGLRSVANSTERNAITTLRRRMGMMAYQQDTDTYYKLLQSPWTNTDSDWVVVTFGGSNVSPYTNILVTASTANNYSGTSLPVITGYSPSNVYLTVFDQTNTVSGATINIESLGTLDLTKVGDVGLVPIDAYDILTGVTYYLIYNGDSMQVLNSAPVDNPTTYTTFLGPTTAAVGGQPIGTTFSAATMQTVFDSIFYTNSTIFTSFYIQQLGVATPIYEVGGPISGSNYTFIWSTSSPAIVKPNSIIIKDNINVTISTPASGMSNDYTEVITLPTITNSAPATYTWKILGTKTNNVGMPLRNYSAVWRFKRIWGNSVLATPTSGMVTTLAYSDLNSQIVSGTFPFSGAAGTYKHICYPSTTPSASLFKDQLTLLNMAMADPSDGYTIATPNNNWYYQLLPVTNQFGITNTYKCFRSKYQLGGAININVT